MGVYSEYLRILSKELNVEYAALKSFDSPKLYDSAYFLNVTHRIMEIAKNATILRCGNNIGHLTDLRNAYESDSAHTNLVRALVNYAFDFVYGWSKDSPTYTRREVDEAILIHDLPENDTGDMPDNGTRDERQKLKEDNQYYDSFLGLYDSSEAKACSHIKRLLKEMEEKSSEEGRILYLADKAAAIIMMLCYDNLGLYPYACPDDRDISEINRAEMKFCDIKYRGGHLLSEVWTNDFLFARELTRYDDTGFFTALIIMSTLHVRGKWYEWREKQY